MERWAGRVALVTGASVGIGAVICRELVKHGMRVVGCARNVDKIREIALTLPEGSLLPVKCDLTKEQDIVNLFKEIREKYGRIDVCVNNAGFSANSSLINGNTDEWRSMLDVNVLALCICTRESIKLMNENNITDGQIIHISSMAGHRVLPGRVSFYSGTKFMVRALTEGLRRELRAANSRIRIASISPGIVETEFMYRMHSEDPSKAQNLYGSMDALQPEDIANLVVSVLQTPPHVNVNDVLVRPVQQEL